MVLNSSISSNELNNSYLRMVYIKALKFSLWTWWLNVECRCEKCLACQALWKTNPNTLSVLPSVSEHPSDKLLGNLNKEIVLKLNYKGTGISSTEKERLDQRNYSRIYPVPFRDVMQSEQTNHIKYSLKVFCTSCVLTVEQLLTSWRDISSEKAKSASLKQKKDNQ